MAQELGNPLRILHIGLASRHGFDVLGIDDHDRPVRFQDGKYRSPVNARRFHGDLAHVVGAEPIVERQEPAGHGRKVSEVALDLAVLGR